MPYSSSDGCSVCSVTPAVSPIVGDCCIRGTDGEHLYGGDEPLGVFLAEFSQREVLLEEVGVIGAGTFCESICLTICAGKEKLVGVEVGPASS